MDCSWLKGLDKRRSLQSPIFYQNKKGAFDAERICLGLGIDRTDYAKLTEYIKYLTRDQNANGSKQVRREIRQQMRKTLQPLLQNLPSAWVAKCIDQLCLTSMSKMPRIDRRERSRRSHSLRGLQHSYDSRHPVRSATQSLTDPPHDAPGMSRRSINQPGTSQLGYQTPEDTRSRIVTVKSEYNPRDYMMLRPTNEPQSSRDYLEFHRQTSNVSFGRYGQETTQPSSKFQTNNWSSHSESSASGNRAADTNRDTSRINDMKTQNQGILQNGIKDIDGHKNVSTGNSLHDTNVSTNMIMSRPPVSAQAPPASQFSVASQPSIEHQHSQILQPLATLQPSRTLPPAPSAGSSMPPQSLQVSQQSENSAKSQQVESIQLQTALQKSIPSLLITAPSSSMAPERSISSQKPTNLQFPAASLKTIPPQSIATTLQSSNPEISVTSRQSAPLHPPLAFPKSTPPQSIAALQPSVISEKLTSSNQKEILEPPIISQAPVPPILIADSHHPASPKESLTQKLSSTSQKSTSREMTINETAFMARRGTGDWVLLGTGADLAGSSDTPDWEIFVSRLVAGLEYSSENDRIFCPWLSYTNGEELVEVFDAFGWRAGLGNMSRRGLCEFRFEVKEQMNPPAITEPKRSRSSSLSTLDSYNDQ